MCSGAGNSRPVDRGSNETEPKARPQVKDRSRLHKVFKVSDQEAEKYQKLVLKFNEVTINPMA